MKRAIKVGRGSKPKSTSSPKKPVTPEALIEQGNLALSNLQLELAAQFFKRALTMSPTDTNIMDALADVMLQLGEQQTAFELLQTSTSTAPTENPYKWCYFAQLQTGEEAVSSYKRGIEIMSDLFAQDMQSDSLTHIPRQIAKAHCSIAELYMTDLCFDDDAESKCDASIQAAFAVDSTSLDAKQTLASFRLSQQRKPDAVAIMEEVYAKIADIREKLAARTVIEEITGAPDAVDVLDVPEPDFCITTAKLLIECADAAPHMLEFATTLIEGLLLEDDENVELWYMMGVAALSKNPPDLESARFHLDRAKEMLDELLRQFKEAGNSPEEFPFADQYCLIEEHVRMLVEKEEAAGIQPGGIAAAGADQATGDMLLESLEEEEEWSSCDEEDEGAMET